MQKIQQFIHNFAHILLQIWIFHALQHFKQFWGHLQLSTQWHVFLTVWDMENELKLSQ